MTRYHSYDLVILGGGAAAFAAITEADRRGHSTAIVNTGLPLGGTCVNVGCIPSKHLLEVGKTAFEPPHNPFDAVQYDAEQPSTDWKRAIEEKDRLVAALREQNYVSVADRFDTTIYEGYGGFADPTTIEVVDGPDSGTTINAAKVLVATGSSPRIAPIDGIEDVDYETSETILGRNELPESIVMIGGGFVGMEWSQILHHMGVDVTILQRSNHVLSGMDPQLGRELQQWFEEEGITIVTGAPVTQVDVAATSSGEGVTITADVDGASSTFTAADLFIATGVTPNTDNICLNDIGVQTDETGAIVVDEELRTTQPDVYAAGDCIGTPMLETIAAKEGNHAVRNAFGNDSVHIDYTAVPAVVYTSPEVATVGMTEAAYMDEHGTCTCRTVRMDDVPKAKAVNDTRGLVQVVKHHETDKIVGVHMVGPRAADMIPEATLAVKFGLTVDDIIDTIHPFPTFSEAFKHACQAFRRDVTKMSCCVE